MKFVKKNLITWIVFGLFSLNFICSNVIKNAFSQNNAELLYGENGKGYFLLNYKIGQTHATVDNSNHL
jgi:hypothetical protein